MLPSCSSTKSRPFLCAGVLALLSTPALAHVVLDAPNGGEAFRVGSSVTIQWHVAISHPIQNWDLWYSTTGIGGPFISIATDLPAGSNQVGSVHTFDWKVPDTSSSNVFVRVRMDTGGTDYYDVSDSALAIVDRAQAIFRNGSEVNKACFESISLPVLGSAWKAKVTHPAIPATMVTLVVGRGSPAMGPIIEGGEILVDLGSPRLFLDTVLSKGTSDLHSIPIPDELSMSGIRVYTQAVLFGGTGLRFCNAIDLELGY